ncbi:MAG TPA: UvrD-helicase domain-containing protein [Longimicrobiales bacterium]|nr:UvrD-helicase domain-containing protein [Longimicrobiales bacterium]
MRDAAAVASPRTRQSGDHLSGLNPEQREAVEHFEGPILVLAGAGSGKTRVLTTRVIHLVEERGVDPAGILAVTFTNKAAGEMRARVRRGLGREPAGMWLGTFHSVGARLLRRHASALGWSPSYSIYDADQTLREIKRSMEHLEISPKRWHPKAVQGTISGAKNRLIDPDGFAAEAIDPFSRKVAEIYPAYQKRLRAHNAFDFDDLLVKPVELFRERPDILERYRDRFAFLLVDEYQDTNHAQYRFLRLLAGVEGPAAGGTAGRGDRDGERANIMVVGDDDQSIYAWRGADIANILDFESDFPDARVVRLERNYRSTANILDAANRVISQNIRRKGKTLRTEEEEGERLTRVEALDERDEACWIGDQIEARVRDGAMSLRDFVVLYRTNAQSRALEEELLRRDLPYQVIGGTRFYERREIQDVLAYLRLVSNPRDTAAFDRIVNAPRRGIGDVSRARVLQAAADGGTGALEAAASAGGIDGVGGAAARSLARFAAMIERFAGLARHVGVGELLETLLEEIRFVEALRREGPEGDDRVDNVRELQATAHDFDTRPEPDDEEPDDAAAAVTPLDRFLQRISLVTDLDRHDDEADAVSLMTLHNAKGLEFPVVFVAGLEDGLFPLSSSFDDPASLEEERRLFYVGLTRAERKLFLTHARSRRRAGEVLRCIPSSFLQALEDGPVEVGVTSALERHQRALGSYGGGGGWRRRERRSDRDAAPFGRPEPGDGLVIDYSVAQAAPRFLKGERVRHPRFGSGVIRELSGLGQDLKATIDFDGVGRKKVIVRYANLQKEL